ncbi:tyrosine--tRNA ligase [Patescibacteria group bacterium]|nr:tyrosine--tRNA ligase [Patescibacteria group bacterium]
MIKKDEKKIDEILNRGVIVDAIPSLKEFKDKLLSGQCLRFYIGADPTSPSLHLSHAKNYLLLEEFRQLGHEVIVLVGDFTARIGDPTDQSEGRKQLSSDEIKENVKGWLEQISPLMDFKDKNNPPKVLYNNKWLSKLRFEKVVDLASNLTIQQLLGRDMFQKRMTENKPIYLHEFLYPLMQGYDSVELDVDVEMCGTDQIFNALVGRTLLKKFKNKNKFVLVVNLMENPKTGEMMSKSRGTGVFLDLAPREMFGAIMSQPDEMTEIFLVNNTRLPLPEVEKIKKMGDKMEAKKIAAHEIIKLFFGEKKTKQAQDNFIKTFQKRELPEDAKEIIVKKDSELKDALLFNNIISSNMEFRRLIKDGAIDFNGEAISDIHFKIINPGVVRVGKKVFVKLVFG